MRAEAAAMETWSESGGEVAKTTRNRNETGVFMTATGRRWGH
jgi:hypothetical protein